MYTGVSNTLVYLDLIGVAAWRCVQSDNATLLSRLQPHILISDLIPQACSGRAVLVEARLDLDWVIAQANPREVDENELALAAIAVRRHLARLSNSAPGRARWS